MKGLGSMSSLHPGFLVGGGGLEAEEGEATGPKALHWVVAELTGTGSCCRLLSMPRAFDIHAYSKQKH